ncbi:MAG: hypothetical protein SVR04_06660, partial [Spirochaetota bacterium]|nr:hypothetical protein [Spirochaetota bacterium]
MKNYRALILTGLFAAAFGFADAQTVSVVNTSLGNDLKRVFPELSVLHEGLSHQFVHIFETVEPVVGIQIDISLG